MAVTGEARKGQKGQKKQESGLVAQQSLYGTIDSRDLTRGGLVVVLSFWRVLLCVCRVTPHNVQRSAATAAAHGQAPSCGCRLPRPACTIVHGMLQQLEKGVCTTKV